MVAMKTELWYSYYEHDTHADRFMHAAAKKHGFALIECTPQSIVDAWQFILDATEDQKASLLIDLAAEHEQSSVHKTLCGDECKYQPERFRDHP